VQHLGSNPLPPFRRSAIPPTATLRSALIPTPAVDVLDPTGCGDVFGAAAAARLFAGDPVEAAIRHANAMAARNAAFRGAGGLSRHLRGELVTP
jgi:sugar/nucleoside kinase (ribokinase family)